MKQRFIALLLIPCLSQMGWADTADDILTKAGITDGLVVHLGCGDGKLTSALCRSGDYLVHELDRDAAKVASARQRLVENGQHGKASAECWTQRTLPFIDNLVNLVVVDYAGHIPMDEIQRVLCPQGVAMVRTGDTWKKVVKQRPGEIDEWTHFLRDASNNAVARDKKVGPPKYLQWKAGPAFTRDHDSLASVSAVTSSNGRIFYILDEGEISLIHRPSKWKLIARDAFNGKLLWKRDISRWITQLANFRAGPAQMPRRLVSVGDRVFVTLGLDAPVEMLDAVTGKTLHTFPGSAKTEEILVHDDMLLAAVGDPNILTDAVSNVDGFWQIEARNVKPVRRKILAYDLESGEEVWRADDDTAAGYTGLSLTAHQDRVNYLDGKHLLCRELQSGKERWRTEFPFRGSFLLNYTPTVVAHGDVILCLTYKQLCAFSSVNGKKLWEQKGAVGFGSAGDLFVIDGLVWTIPMVRFGAVVPWKKSDFLGQAGSEFWGMDLHSGEVKRRVSRRILPGVHHHRCYRNKATEDFLVYGQGGLEFMDLHGDSHSGNLWTRGICQYGVMPANGYVYVPPHPCQCFSQDMLHGFYVLAASNSTGDVELEPDLQKGSTYSDAIGETPRLEVPAKQSGQVWQPPVTFGKSDEWPMYRRDITRSGSSPCELSGSLKQTWRMELGSDLTAVTIADNRLFVSSKAEQILYCLDATSGDTIWQLATPGKVDSPPTVVREHCVFGSVDGSVYCVRARDGALRWRFRISQDERRTLVDDSLESVWPIHGSVLVLQDTVYFAAGRSSHLDGGIRLFGLDLANGELKHQVTLDSEAEGQHRVLTNADLLVADGNMINMGLAQFDRDLNLQPTSRLNTLICDTGFLGDAWFHRENWVLGGVTGTVSQSARTTMATQPRSAQSSVGKLLVFNDATAYGIKNPYSWQKYANRFPTHTGHPHQKYSRYDPKWFPVGSRIFSFDNIKEVPAPAEGRRRRPTKENQRNEKWGVDMAYQPRAIALAGETLVLAGWLDAVAIQPETGLPLDPANPDPRDCVLRTISTKGGKILSECKVPAEPAYDGLAVAYDKIYLPMKSGTVMCLEGE